MVCRSMVFVGVFILALMQMSASGQDLKERLEARVHRSKTHGELPYRIFEPKSVGKVAGKVPLVLFLHGAGERGTDNAAQLRHGVADLVSKKNQALHPSYVVAPQCPKGIRWNDEKLQAMLLEIVEELCEKCPVDRSRLYVTGLSLGGNGTWTLVARSPKLFAAAIPICGWGDPARAAKLSKLPIWVFHGDQDGAVSVERSREMVAALKQAGGRPLFTEYPGVGHNSWTRTYADSAVHAWLFAQRRGQGPVVPLKNGDRVVFFGDSITAAGASGQGYIRLMEADLKKKQQGLEVALLGAGISGHKVPDLQGRLQRDVLGKKPTVVIIYIGINDVWHSSSGRGTKKTDFDKGLRDLVKRIEGAGARVILCTPSVIGEKTDGSNHFDPMLKEYSDITRKVATDMRTQLLDLRERFMAHLRKNNTENKDRGILTTDSVHLNAAGNRFVADCMLDALGVR